MGRRVPVRIHLGHHFYGAGNLGDDFMLAGFLAAMRAILPAATYTCCVPFPLAPLLRRFPNVEWRPYEDAVRAHAIHECDVWLGLGGSPFQSALSQWFVDHLIAESEACARANKPMYFLGVGVQTSTELGVPAIQRICTGAAGIWTRDSASAERLSALSSARPIAAGADLAHSFFRTTPPPPARSRRIAVVPNFDYGAWQGQAAWLSGAARLDAEDHVWLAQESRELPGAERALFRALPPAEQARWRLVSPDQPGADLAVVLGQWPSAEWLITARYHAALAGAWAGSKVVVLSTNEKLRSAARELHVSLLSPDADEATVIHALQSTAPAARPLALAGLADEACAAFVRSAVAHRR